MGEFIMKKHTILFIFHVLRKEKREEKKVSFCFPLKAPVCEHTVQARVKRGAENTKLVMDV